MSLVEYGYKDLIRRYDININYYYLSLYRRIRDKERSIESYREILKI